MSKARVATVVGDGGQQLLQPVFAEASAAHVDVDTGTELLEERRQPIFVQVRQTGVFGADRNTAAAVTIGT
jgi:hypothetical protein